MLAPGQSAAPGGGFGMGQSEFVRAPAPAETCVAREGVGKGWGGEESRRLAVDSPRVLPPPAGDVLPPVLLAA